MNNILTITDLVKIYETEGEKLTVLNKLNLTVEEGSKTVICGESGSGKSTLLNIIGSIDTATSGSVIAGNWNVTSLSEKQMAEYRTSFIGLIFQFHYLLKDFTALENVYMPAYMRGIPKKIAVEKARQLLCDVGLSERENHLHSQLSGGERQRISIARAFLKDAPIILLDEATASLDAENETAIQEALSRLIKNKTVLIIAHRMRTIAKADHIVVLKDGTVAEQGSPEFLSGYDSIYSRMTSQQLISQNWKM